MRRLFLVCLTILGLVQLTPAYAAESYVGTPMPITELEILHPTRTQSPLQVTLKWKEPDSNGSPISSYEVYARITPNSHARLKSDMPWRLIHTSNSPKTEISLKLPFVVRAQSVEFSVVSINAFGRSHEPTSGWVDVAIAQETACAVNARGNVYCWGDSAGYGELGTTEPGYLYPHKIIGLPASSKIAAGDYHYCALGSGEVFCWGLNEHSQVSSKDEFAIAKPQKVSLPGKAEAMSLGQQHSCALLVGGDVYCWGSNEYDQIGSGTGQSPTLVSKGAIRQLDAGGFSTCILSMQGEVSCTGISNNFSLALGDDLGFSPGVKQIAVGVHAICVQAPRGVECRGYGENGELGTSYLSSDVPRLVPDSADFVELYNGKFGVCGIRADREVFCWGFTWVDLQAWKTLPTPGADLYDPSQWGTTLGGGVLSPVQLQNTGPYQLWNSNLMPAPIQTEDGPLFPIDYQQHPGYVKNAMGSPKMRAPKMLAMGAMGSCGIDRFQQLWCSGDPKKPLDIWNGGQAADILSASGEVIGKRHEQFSYVGFINQHFLTRPSFEHYVDIGSGNRVDPVPTSVTVTATLTGNNRPGGTIEAKVSKVPEAKAKFDLIWYRGTGDFVEGNFHNFRVMGSVTGTKYRVKQQDAGYTFAVLPILQSEKVWSYSPAPRWLNPASSVGNAVPFGWTKKMGATQAKMYAKDVIGAGKVSFVLNGKEIAWVNATDGSDPKLRIVGQNNYLVRTVNLSLGKNVLEVFISGERVKRTVYSR